MVLFPRTRLLLPCSLLAITGFFLYHLISIREWYRVPREDNSTPSLKPSLQYTENTPPPTSTTQSPFSWATLHQHFPVTSVIPLPSGTIEAIPTIQKAPTTEDEDIEAKTVRRHRLDIVKQEFQRGWSNYKSRAWLKDELAPLSGGARNVFGGWAASLVDALDTLWILGLREEVRRRRSSRRGNRLQYHRRNCVEHLRDYYKISRRTSRCL